MVDYSTMTNETFDTILREVVEEHRHTLLTIPGVYEILSEHFNNEVLERWEHGKPDADRRFVDGSEIVLTGPSPEAWENLDYETQDDLLLWYNQTEVGPEDMERLADLHNEGQFHAFGCGWCQKRVVEGQPDDWSNFQGVLQMESIGQLCEECASKYLSLKAFAEME
ncbi:MAG TPA: hypothetical protein PK395_20695 [bacterium]|nr:hypothetical protein [bacterium]